MAECQLPANWKAYILYVSTVYIFWIHKYFLIQRFPFNLRLTLYWFYCLTLFHTSLRKQKGTTGYVGVGEATAQVVVTATHHGGLGSVSGQFMQNLCCPKWQ